MWPESRLLGGMPWGMRWDMCGDWNGEERRESTVRTEDLLLRMEDGRNGRTFCVGGGTGRPRRPIGEGLTVPKGTGPLPIILGRDCGVGSLIKRVERRERVGDGGARRGPAGDILRERGGEGERFLLSMGEVGGDARRGETEGDGELISLILPSGLREGEVGGLALLMDARGD